MKKKETLILNKFEVEGNPSIRQVVEKMRPKMYNEKKGLGFTNITIEDDMVFATILLRTPSYIRSYNETEGVFVQQVVNIYGEFEIAIDIENSLLFSTSTSAKFSKAKTLLRECFEKGITYQNVELTAVSMLNKIQNQGMIPYIMDFSKSKDSKLKFLKRYRKFFEYQLMIARFKNNESAFDEYSNDFRKDYTVTDNNSIQCVFDKLDEGIFRAEYRFLIERFGNEDDKISLTVRTLEQVLANKDLLNTKEAFLYYRKH